MLDQISKISRMKKCPLLEELNGSLAYIPEDNGVYNLCIIHKFSKIDLEIQKLLYYITHNGEHLYTKQPELINTLKTKDGLYKSTYTLKFNHINSNENTYKLIVVLPFDYKTNIFQTELFKIFEH